MSENTVDYYALYVFPIYYALYWTQNISEITHWFGVWLDDMTMLIDDILSRNLQNVSLILNAWCITHCNYITYSNTCNPPPIVHE